MTTLVLLAYICAAILLQVAAGISVALWRRSARAGLVQPPAPDDVMPTNAWAGWRDFRVARRAFEDAAESQCSFYLEPVDGGALPPFLPGQFLTFRLALDETRALTRCYSLSDRPSSTSYRVTIKRASPPAERPDLPHGEGSCHLHDRVHEGDIVKVKAPAGSFFIDPDETVPLVLVAGGIGITPMMSMLRWCAHEQKGRSIHLFYGVRNRLDHAWKTELEELAASHPSFHVHVAYSRPGEGDKQGRDFEHEGYVDVALLRRTLPDHRRQFYVCGPPAMMASLVPALEAWGVPKDDIRHEAFGPASGRAAAPLGVASGTAPLEIKFRRSGRTLAWQGEDANLLDFAERHGLVVESGCRSGSCGGCEVRVLSGDVRYAQKPDHDVARGHCLLCVGTPASPLELEV
jgi:ferredoxin-NADP reductase